MVKWKRNGHFTIDPIAPAETGDKKTNSLSVLYPNSIFISYIVPTVGILKMDTICLIIFLIFHVLNFCEHNTHTIFVRDVYNPWECLYH